MAELFGVEVNTINYHLKEIFASGELEETSVIRKIRITAEDGKQYLTGLYSLDVIIAIGYRVNSYQATRFRIWATQVLKEYMIKGFALTGRILAGKYNMESILYFVSLKIYYRLFVLHKPLNLKHKPGNSLTRILIINKYNVSDADIC